eukprot:m.218938 g.218938  ORF g.218938 m.218938 type:complete len:82 (-) comp15908_c0_seq26:1565-1810(-)
MIVQGKGLRQSFSTRQSVIPFFIHEQFVVKSTSYFIDPWTECSSPSLIFGNSSFALSCIIQTSKTMIRQSVLPLPWLLSDW